MHYLALCSIGFFFTDVDEANLIRTAISAVVTQLKECVTFEETQRVAPVFKVHFTPLTGGTYVLLR